MKNYFCLIVILILSISCRKNKQENEWARRKDSVSQINELTRLRDLAEQRNNPQKDIVRQLSNEEKKNIIDSLKYFTMSPAKINEVYMNYTGKNAGNLKYMQKTVRNSKYILPELVEKIKDTTITSNWIFNEYYYRIGDLAVQLIDISHKENLQNFILEEFNESDLENIQNLSQEYIGFKERVYLPLFYNKDGSVNMKNRNRLYQLYKRKLSK